MAPRTKVPDRRTLERWRDEGYTQAEMVDLIQEEFGETVSRSAVANAMARYGLAEEKPRYEDEVPWRINPVHATMHALRMLRLLGRRNQFDDLSDYDTRSLDRWLTELKELKLIVGYDPDDIQGFRYISSKFKDHRKAVPNRRQLLWMDAPTR